MKKFTLTIMGLAFIAINALSNNLWIIGDATPYGWSTDDATALLSKFENESLYTGTIYLKANQDFKFMTVPDWGNIEYGAAEGAELNNGEISLARGTDDSGYGKIQVSESANYYISVDTEALVATIVKSEYQDTEITLSSLFLVGDATEGGWSVDNGTPLYQEKESPYVYSALVNLKEGSFKIATVIKGGGSWDPKYYYFCDPSDPSKIILNNSDDTQWIISMEGDYSVSVNTHTNTISILPSSESGVDLIEISGSQSIEYYTLSGLKTNNPKKGIYIRKQGKRTEKVIFK